MRRFDPHEGFDEASYQLGIIDAFCEMVAAGVKRLALSHPLDARLLPVLEGAAGAMAASYGVRSRIEREFIPTDLAPPGAVAGKIVILFYRDDSAILEYDRLAKECRELVAAGAYTPGERKDITLRLCSLLGYPGSRLRSLYPD